MMKYSIYTLMMSFLTIQFGYSLEPVSQKTTLSNQTKSNQAGDTLSYSSRIHRARELAGNRQYRQAIDIYSKLIEGNANDLDVLIARGRVYAWKGDYNKAETDLLMVTRLNPEYGDAWSALGYLYLWWHKPGKAADALSSTIDLIPDNPDLYISRARAKMGLDQFNSAIEDLKAAKSIGGNPELIKRLSAEIDKKIRIKVSEKTAHLLAKADSLFTHAVYDSALAMYLNILEKDSTIYSAHFKCAQCYSRKGNYEGAVAIYTKLISIDSTDADARLERGRILTWMKKYKQAEEDLRFVTSHFPEYGGAWSVLATMYLWNRQYGKALNVYTNWNRIEPDNPAPFLGLAEVYRQTRLYPLARENLITAAHLGASKKLIQKKLRSLDRIVSPTQWEMRNQYEFQYIGEGRSNWHQFSSEVKREMPWGSMIMDLFRVNRFEKWDEAMILETYFDFWTRSYMNLRFQTAFNADILPLTDLNVELFQGFGNGWEVSGNYRYMGFTGNEIHSWGLSFSKYMGDWFGLEKTSFFSGKKSQGFTQSLSLRRYFGIVDHFVEVRVGFGQTIALVGSGPKIEARSTNFFTASYQKFLNPDWGLSGTAAYNIEEKLPIRIGLFLGLIRRL